MAADGGAHRPAVGLGAEALAALGSPARFALFGHLVDSGPQTATQCAEVLDE